MDYPDFLEAIERLVDGEVERRISEGMKHGEFSDLVALQSVSDLAKFHMQFSYPDQGVPDGGPLLVQIFPQASTPDCVERLFNIKDLLLDPQYTEDALLEWIVPKLEEIVVEAKARLRRSNES
ncbi:hypothetical protein [Burkholderia gladioli]|uniref:hypothetical protein n=1 Tax=Burkholderia gladioli TaxID=28095 RepID=UPI0034DAD326